MHSELYATSKVMECMWPHGGAAEDWEDANPRRRSGGSGRCGIPGGNTLCDNAYCPAEELWRWLTRGRRRSGLASAFILCDYVYSAEGSHTAVGRGVRRGGRCGYWCCVRFCSSVYLAWSKVEANGEACQRWRCGFLSRVSLCANVFVGMGGEAEEGGIDEGRRGEMGSKREEGQGGVSRGAGGVEEVGGHTIWMQAHQLTTLQHTQSTPTLSLTCGHSDIGIGANMHHTRHRYHCTGCNTTPILRDFHISLLDGYGVPAKERNGPKARRPEQEEYAARRGLSCGSGSPSGLAVDVHQRDLRNFEGYTDVSYAAELSGDASGTCHLWNLSQSRSYPRHVRGGSSTNGGIAWRQGDDSGRDGDEAKDAGARRGLTERKRRRPRPGRSGNWGNLAQWAIWTLLGFPWLLWRLTTVLAWRQREGITAAGSKASGRPRRCKGRRGAARPQWLGTWKWAIECTKVRRRRHKRTRLAGCFRVLRLGDQEWWRREWRPWKGKDLRAHQHAWRSEEHRERNHPLELGEGTAHRWMAPEACCSKGDLGIDPPQYCKVNGRPRGELARRGNYKRRRLVGYGRGRAVVVAIMVAALLGLRIGEASHPGFGIQDPDLMHLKETALEGKQGVRLSYADPEKQGFRGGKSPGFHKEDRRVGRGKGGPQESRMIVESANVTGPAGLRTRLRGTHADILLAQETWATEESIPDLREWARKQKWSSLWAPAKPGSNGGRPSGGTAIFVRSHLGLREPDAGGLAAASSLRGDC